MSLALSDLLFVLTCAIYLGAFVMFGAQLVGRGVRVATLAPRLLLVGALLHAGHIVSASFVLHVCPVGGIHFPMSVFSLAMCAAYLALRGRRKIDVIGAFIAPLALTSLLASRFVGAGELTPSAKIKSVILPIHITMNMIGVALFSLAFAAAALYLVQERLLKRKKVFGLFQRLPPLDALDRAEHQFLLAGFPLLTLGVITGTLWAQKVEMGHAQDLLRAAFGYVTWMLFAGVLLLRAAAGWRGRRAAYGTIAGFGCALFVIVLYLFRTQPVPQPRAATPHGTVTASLTAERGP